ncbi:MAG: AMP-binding protein [Actinomycetales bacterium]|nr:AMP-binding protein [Actinomycetales bacterium]
MLGPWLAGDGEPIEIRTSGSTGEPKTIRLSRESVLASASATLEYLGGPGRWLMALPPTGMGGFQVLVRSALAGIEPVFLDDYLDLTAAIAELRAREPERAYLSLVPTQLHRLAESGHLADLAVFDTVLLGGAATSKQLLAAADAAGVNIVRTYGMTETAGGCIYDGYALAGVQMRIEADGRISLAGPMLFEGAPEWWTTQDLGRITDDRLEVLGRADQVAISGGVNIPLGAVEAVLAEVATVQQIIVVARADAEWGQVVTACVRGTLDRQTAADALETAGYPRAWAPRVIEVWDTFPLLAGGKVDRLALTEPRAE